MNQFWQKLKSVVWTSLTGGAMLIRWAWYDWIALAVVVFLGPFSVVFAIFWVCIKLAIGEDFKALKQKEKAFYYYQKELKNSHYLVGVLKRQLDAKSNPQPQAQPSQLLQESNKT